MLGEAVEEQKPAAAAAADVAAGAVEASALVEPSPVQSPGNEEVMCSTLLDVQPKKRKMNTDVAQKTK